MGGMGGICVVPTIFIWPQCPWQLHSWMISVRWLTWGRNFTFPYWKGPFIAFSTDVLSTTAQGCFLCIHIGTVAIYFGGWAWPGHRLELFTPLRRFRFTRGRKK